MKHAETKIVDTLILPEGFEIDLDEGWKKITQRQFGGPHARAFGELLQNSIDSYSNNVSFPDRKGIIETGEDTISIADFGEGLSIQKLRFLTTLGGTDKHHSEDKIGKFGIGFFSIFNPKLFTKELIVQTKCEGHWVELIFIVRDPDKRPEIKAKILEKREYPFSTKIIVKFSNNRSPQLCVEYARKYLTYFPCQVLINGLKYKSIWEHAKQKKFEIFELNNCTGFIDYTPSVGSHVRLLRRYEKISELPTSAFTTGSIYYHQSVNEYAKTQTPFLKGAVVTLNSDEIKTTIGRDAYQRDQTFHKLIDTVNTVLMQALYSKLKAENDTDIIIINQFILADKIRNFIEVKNENEAVETEPAVRYLARSKVYTVKDREGLFSLEDLHKMRSLKAIPFFFTPFRQNLKWLGGAFKHDYIALPPLLKHNSLNCPSDLYDILFKKIFSNIVNLDTIEKDTNKINDLIRDGIIDQASLTPECELIGACDLSENEVQLLEELNHILSDNTIKHIISKNLHLPISKVSATFFQIQDGGLSIATGFFDEEGRPIGADGYCNLNLDSEDNNFDHGPKPLFLGLMKNHELIRRLIESKDRDRVYYMLIYLSYELTLCQKLLVPLSPYFHVVRERLVRDLRSALIDRLLTQQAA